MSGVVLREAGLVDVAAIAPLFDAYRQFYGQPSDEAGAGEFLAARLAAGESVVILAEAAGLPVGFTQLYPSFSSVRMSSIFVINDLFVAAEARRGGVAKALLSAAAAAAKRRGAIRLSLSTGISNRPAQALYEACGWVRDEDFVTYELTLTNGNTEA